VILFTNNLTKAVIFKLKFGGFVKIFFTKLSDGVKQI